MDIRKGNKSGRQLYFDKKSDKKGGRLCLQQAFLFAYLTIKQGIIITL